MPRVTQAKGPWTTSKLRYQLKNPVLPPPRSPAFSACEQWRLEPPRSTDHIWSSESEDTSGGTSQGACGVQAGVASGQGHQGDVAEEEAPNGVGKEVVPGH